MPTMTINVTKISREFDFIHEILRKKLTYVQADVTRPISPPPPPPPPHNAWLDLGFRGGGSGGSNPPFGGNLATTIHKKSTHTKMYCIKNRYTCYITCVHL